MNKTQRYEQSAKGKATRRRWREQHPENYRALNRANHEVRRAILREAKNQPCVDCGGRFPPRVMDLHHRDPTQKKFTMARISSRGITAIEAEVAKCDVLCANCHRERHI